MWAYSNRDYACSYTGQNIQTCQSNQRAVSHKLTFFVVLHSTILAKIIAMVPVSDASVVSVLYRQGNQTIEANKVASPVLHYLPTQEFQWPIHFHLRHPPQGDSVKHRL